MIFSRRVINQNVNLHRGDTSRCRDFLAFFVYKNIASVYNFANRKIKAMAAKMGAIYHNGFYDCDNHLKEKYFPWLLIKRNHMAYYKLRSLKDEDIKGCARYCRISKYFPVEMITEDIIFSDILSYPKIMKLLPRKSHVGCLMPHSATVDAIDEIDAIDKINDKPDWCDRLITKLVRKNPSYLMYVPDRFKTSEIVHFAVNEMPVLLRFVPRRLQTFEMCRIAYEKYESAKGDIKIANFHNMLAEYEEQKR